MTDYFTADHHMSHFNMTCHPDSKNLCNRPWDNVDDMNEALITNWNETVGPKDRVLYLGDFAMGTIKESLPLIAKLHGNIQLVPGNHDRCFPANKHWLKWEETYRDAGFQSVHNTIAWLDEFDLCHFPFAGDSHDRDRYKAYRPVQRNRPLIHGHIHDKWKISNEYSTPMINVGVDVWDYRPVSIDQIRSMI